MRLHRASSKPRLQQLPPDQVVGYDVTIVVYTTGFLTQEIEKHWRGTEATCLRKARLQRRFKEVASMTPVTAGAWMRTYGDGPM